MSGPRRSRSTVIVVLLVATLAMTATLAYEAQHAARSHRTTAENVLRDYSTFAVWELTRLGRQQLLHVINQELEEVSAAARGGRLETALVPSRRCSGCGGAHRIRSAFHLTLSDAAFAFAGDPVSPAVRQLLQQAVDDRRRTPDHLTCPVMQIASVDGLPVVIVWRPVIDRANRLGGIVGFVSDTRFVADVFEKLAKHHPLLPPSLVPAGANPNSALAVRVSTRDQQRLFASTTEWSGYEAHTDLPAELGSLKLAVALRPDAAGGLVIGGLPRERLPFVVGLLTLTAGLVVVALVQLRREAELSRLRSDFVSGVSHELRTPLAQIRMFTETLLLGRVRSEAEGRRSLEIIAREAQRLAQLVENVLLFSRGERGRPEIVQQRSRLAPIVADIVEGFAPLAAGRQTHLTMALDETVTASVDAGAVRQILLNLLDNAVKYGPTGQTIAISLRLDGGKARLAVEDEGPGIETEDADRIWQPFSRLTRSAGATGGAGIGLAIVRQLTELHGGRAWVERTPGGARFLIELPDAWQEAGAVTAVA